MCEGGVTASSFRGSGRSSVAAHFLSRPRGRQQARRAEGGGFSTKRRRRLWLRFSQVGFTREENLEIRSHAAPTPTTTTTPGADANHPLKQPRNVRAPLKPLSVHSRCGGGKNREWGEKKKKTSVNATCKGKKKKKKKRCLCGDEWTRCSLCFGPNMAILLTPGCTLTLTGLRTKITPSCLRCFSSILSNT